MYDSAALLRKVLGSPTLARLLVLFHKYPDINNTVNVIAERIGEKSSVVEKLLLELADSGFLKETRLYSVNHDVATSFYNDFEKYLLSGKPLEQVTIAKKIHSTGIDALDHLLPDGWITPTSAVALGDPGAGKTILCQQFAAHYLRTGRMVVYMATEEFPRKLREELSQQRMNASEYERAGLLRIIDCYSQQIGIRTEPYAEDPSNLSALSILISSLVKGKKGILIIDSFSTMLQKAPQDSCLEFLRTVIAKAKAAEYDCLVSLNRKYQPESLVNTIQDMEECVIEMKSEEEKGGVQNSIRVLKMSTGPHLANWMLYQISSERRIESKAALGRV